MKKIFLLAMCVLLCATPLDAKNKKEKKAPEAQSKADADKKKDEANKCDVERPGLFKVTKVKTDWFFEFSDSLLGKDMLTTTRYISTPSSSGKFGGEECNEQVVYFEMNTDSTVFLRSRMFVNIADSTEQINKAVTVANENPIIAAFKLESYKDKKIKIKVNGFFNDDNSLGIHNQLRSAFNLGAPQGGLSYIDDIKSFPTNTEVRLVKTYGSSSKSLPAAREVGKLTFILNISFIMLPEQPMSARYFDPRVGYFTVGYNSYTDQQQRVQQKIYTTRWRLEPRPEDIQKMQAGELVEPIKPIVYYIDPATPKQWRKYLIQGVNDWQKAFEKAGFKNAIYAKEWPEDSDSTMSMEDARYSVIRYLASPIPNAYGPHVSDPRTGEILESHICWYHNVMSLVHDWYMVQASSIDEAARKMNYDEELMGQLIRFVSSHEVGHTLGLRHNFGSSSTVPVDSLRDKAWTDAHGHTPSIMDYARFNYVAQPEDGIDTKGIFPRINDYDMWAIQWGYTPMFNAKNADEDHQMMEVMTRTAQKNKRLWWGDGESNNTDPRRQREDLGDDAVKASEYGIKNLKREIVNLPAWTADDKDIYDQNLQEMYTQIMTQYLRYMGHVASYIGGTYENFRTRQEGGTLYEPTPLARQKSSLDFLQRNLMTEPTWFREVSYASSLTEDVRDLTTPIATNGAYYIVNRINETNSLYPAEKYIDDIVRLCFSEAGSGKTVTKYRETLQRSIVSRLISGFSASTGSNHANMLYALKAVQSKVKAAASSDAHTRSHFANLSDQIARTLVIK